MKDTPRRSKLRAEVHRRLPRPDQAGMFPSARALREHCPGHAAESLVRIRTKLAAAGEIDLRGTTRGECTTQRHEDREEEGKEKRERTNPRISS